MKPVLSVIRIGTLTLGVVREKKLVVRIILGRGDSPILSAARMIFPTAGRKDEPAVLHAIRDFLSAKKRFIPLDYREPDAAVFQKTVLREVRKIPWGQTLSYSGLARRIGRPGAARAVGAALAANPLPLLIPCHRVVRADGSAGGFMGQSRDMTGWKSFLLNREHESGPPVRF